MIVFMNFVLNELNQHFCFALYANQPSKFQMMTFEKFFSRIINFQEYWIQTKTEKFPQIFKSIAMTQFNHFVCLFFIGNYKKVIFSFLIASVARSFSFKIDFENRKIQPNNQRHQQISKLISSFWVNVGKFCISISGILVRN